MLVSQWVDISILVIIGLSVITGLVRGFIKELIAICIWVLAIWLAVHYNTIFDKWLSAYIQDTRLKNIIGFIIVLLGTLFIGGILNNLFGLALKNSGLSSMDRLLGVGFGFARGVLIVAFIMAVVQFTSLPYEDYTKQSKLYTKFDPLVKILSSYVPDLIKKVKILDKSQHLTEAYQNLEESTQQSSQQLSDLNLPKNISLVRKHS